MRFLLFLILLILSTGCNNSKTELTEENIDAKPTHKVTSLVSSTTENLNNPPLTTFKVDSTNVKDLKKFTKSSFDEYTGITWIEPLDAPKNRSSNAMFCYFGTKNAVPISLRFVIQYYSSDWLFIKYYRFVIDGESYTYFPDEVKTDNGYGGKIWEWSDKRISNIDIDIIKALANANAAKVKFEGSQYYAERIITTKQLNEIKNIYNLYTAMGGEIEL